MENMRLRTMEDYQQAYQQSVDDPEGFWTEIAQKFVWQKPWKRTLKWNFKTPKVEWFKGGKLNITENCLDRHLDENGDKVALIWEPNDIKKRPKKYTYRKLHGEVCKFANALKAQGIKKGDRIALYMPMIPELTIAVLACARIGAIHSVVFAGFSAISLADRIKDAKAKMVLTADVNLRGAKTIPVKQVVDEALALGCDSVETVIVYNRADYPVTMQEGRDIWWHEAIKHRRRQAKATAMDAEDTLFILYTSGSTGNPKGVVHTIGGYMVFTAYTFQNVFQYESDDIYWCTADIGWITGHSYIIYGPLLAGATTVMFEGTPTYPSPSRFWQVCERHKVNIFYTAPTAIRALMGCGNSFVKSYNLKHLKVLGSVGEPINEEAWQWYYDKVGKGRCPIVDTWWQTETGGIMISPIAHITPLKPTYATLPLPGVQPVLLTAEGKEIKETEAEGLLCIKFPWPSMLRTIYNDPERCREVYFAPFKNMYFTGDGARRDQQGMYRIIGRVDDVINVSGHRIGTAEVENAIDEHPAVIESAVVGYPHDIKGQGICAFVITNQSSLTNMTTEIGQVVSKFIGPIAKPDKILAVNALPKTRSGKIMRRILRKIAAGETENFGDTSTLLNPDCVAEILNSIKTKS